MSGKEQLTQPMLTKSYFPIWCVTRPQWVNTAIKLTVHWHAMINLWCWGQNIPGRTGLKASCQIHKIACCHAPGMPGPFSPPPGIKNPDMHHSTCMMHVPMNMPWLPTGSVLWSWWRGKRSWHSQCMRNPQFYVSCKRLMPWLLMSGSLHHQVISIHSVSDYVGYRGSVLSYC